VHVRDAMTRAVVTVRPDTRAKCVAERGFAALPLAAADGDRRPDAALR
jgi:hypothetical protein